MSAPLPSLTPAQLRNVDEFHAACSQLLDHYMKGFEVDFNRHAVKHGPIPEERAVYDMTLLLAKQVQTREVPVNMLAGITALAIVRGIAKKREGKG